MALTDTQLQKVNVTDKLQKLPDGEGLQRHVSRQAASSPRLKSDTSCGARHVAEITVPDLVTMVNISCRCSYQSGRSVAALPANPRVPDLVQDQ